MFFVYVLIKFIDFVKKVIVVKEAGVEKRDCLSDDSKLKRCIMLCGRCGKETHILVSEDIDNVVNIMVCNECKIKYLESLGIKVSMKDLASPKFVPGIRINQSATGAYCSSDDPVMYQTDGEYCVADGPFIFDIYGDIIDQC